MKLISIFIILFLIIFEVNAQPQSIINTALSCKKILECPYFFKLYNDPYFKDAFLNLLNQHRTKKPAWLENGVSSPAVPLLINKHIYLITSVCKPHACPDNYYTILYNPAKKGLYALHTGEVSRKPTILGNPTDNERQVLLDHDHLDSPLRQALNNDKTVLPIEYFKDTSNNNVSSIRDFKINRFYQSSEDFYHVVISTDRKIMVKCVVYNYSGEPVTADTFLITPPTEDVSIMTKGVSSLVKGVKCFKAE